MTSYAVDMLTPSIQPTAIRAAGFSAVCRYLRNLTVAEARGYLSAGLGLATIFETQATEALGGAAAGLADGRTAAAQCQALSQPPGTLLWVNLADFAPPPADIPAITAYWRAFRAVTAGLQVGGYATGYVIDQLVRQGESGPWWQNAIDDSGWSGTMLHPQTSLYQDTIVTLPAIAGTSAGDYDQDVIIGSALKWWTAQPEPPGGHMARFALPAAALPATTRSAGWGPGNRWDVVMDGHDGHVYHIWWDGIQWRGPEDLTAAG